MGGAHGVTRGQRRHGRVPLHGGDRGPRAHGGLHAPTRTACFPEGGCMAPCMVNLCQGHQLHANGIRVLFPPRSTLGAWLG